MAKSLFSYRTLQPLKRTSHSLKLSYSTISSIPPAFSPSEADLNSAQTYCQTLLQKYDTPSHTLLAFIYPPSRPAYLALRALNLELAHIPDTTTTTPLSALRFQFWRDQISHAYEPHPTPPRHPVSLLLSHALSSLHTRTRSTLSKPFLHRAIAAREAYSDGRPYTTLDALERYAEDAYSTLLYLTLQSLPLASVTADHIASHVGKAMGIAAVLRGVPLLAFPGPARHHRSAQPLQGESGGGGRGGGGHVALPLDVMARAGVREEDVLRMGAGAEGVRDAVFEVATRASDHLITAREMAMRGLAGISNAEDHDDEGGYDEGTVNGEEGKQQQQQQMALDGKSKDRAEKRRSEVLRAWGVFMPAVSTQLWLDRLQRVDFDVFHEEVVRGREWRLGWKAYWAYRRRRF